MECFGVMLKTGENGFHLNLITVIKQVMFGIFIVSGGFYIKTLTCMTLKLKMAGFTLSD